MEKTLTKADLDACSQYIKECQAEMAKRIVGQKEVID